MRATRIDPVGAHPQHSSSRLSPDPAGKPSGNLVSSAFPVWRLLMLRCVRSIACPAMLAGSHRCIRPDAEDEPDTNAHLGGPRTPARPEWAPGCPPAPRCGRCTGAWPAGPSQVSRRGMTAPAAGCCRSGCQGTPALPAVAYGLRSGSAQARRGCKWTTQIGWPQAVYNTVGGEVTADGGLKKHTRCAIRLRQEAQHRRRRGEGAALQLMHRPLVLRRRDTLT